MPSFATQQKKAENAASSNKSNLVIQPKLTVNTPNDRYEQEADAVADQVMRMPDPSRTPSVSDAPFGVSRLTVSSLQRKCEHCEEKEKLQRKETGHDAAGMSAPTSVYSTLSSGGGHSLDKGTQQFMESRFNRDFSQVRVHTDRQAATSAHDIQARAYTSGNHIVFGKGEYQPHTEGGKRLLAHELVHTVQQGQEVIRRNPAIPVAVGAGLSAGDTAGIAIGTVGILQSQINSSQGGVVFQSDQATYPTGLGIVPSTNREINTQAARFTSRGNFVNNDTNIHLRGNMGTSTEGHPIMANLRLVIYDTTSYSHSALSFTARALTTPYGTVGDPHIRFECSGRFDPVGSGDATYYVILNIDKNGGCKAIEKRITNGEGTLTERGWNGFTLDIGTPTY